MSEALPEQKAFIVFRGTPEIFYLHDSDDTRVVMDDAIDYLNCQTEDHQEVHTMMMVDAKLLEHSFVAEFVGVRRTTLGQYRKAHSDE